MGNGAHCVQMRGRLFAEALEANGAQFATFFP